MSFSTPQQSETESDQFFSPFDELGFFLRHWWWLVLTAILGAGLGLLINFMQPPIYSGEAKIVTAIDFNRTGALDDIARDQLLGAAEDLMTVPGTFAAAAEDAALQGYVLDGAEFRQIAVVERGLYTWTLRVTDTDPKIAADLANIWALRSFDRLKEAYRHAVMAETLLQRADELAGCLEKAAAVEPGQPLCGYTRLADLQPELEQLSAAAERERSAAYGLSTAMTYALSDPAQPAVEPVRNSRAILVLAGILIGLVIGFISLSAGLPRFSRRGAKLG